MADQLQITRITPVALPYLSSDHTAVHGREREVEIHMLTDLRIRQTVEELGIRLASYVDRKAG